MAKAVAQSAIPHPLSSTKNGATEIPAPIGALFNHSILQSFNRPDTIQQFNNSTIQQAGYKPPSPILCITWPMMTTRSISSLLTISSA